MPRNAIGNFEFIRLDGSLEVPLMSFAIESRAGVDGYAIYQTGSRGQPIRVRSVVDTPNWAMAEVVYVQYTTTIGSIVQAWQNYITLPSTWYFVQRVGAPQIHNNIIGVGGLNGGATLLRCVWDLLPIFRMPK